MRIIKGFIFLFIMFCMLGQNIGAEALKSAATTRLVISAIGRNIYTTVCIDKKVELMPPVTLILGRLGEPSIQAPLQMTAQGNWYRVSIVSSKYPLTEGGPIGRVRIESSALHGVHVEEVNLSEAIMEFRRKNQIGDNVGQRDQCDKSILSEATSVAIEQNIGM